MEVCIWKYGREVRGWDGKPETYEKVLKFPVVDLATALYSVYKSWAHFCPAIVYEFDAPLSVQPRINKVALEELRKAGKTIKFSVIAMDIDAPGKNATEEWRQDEKEKINASAVCSNAIYYETVGGYRLVWALEQKVEPEQYEKLLTALRSTLLKDGIIPDELKDWSRGYGLPKVTKDDGVKVDLPLLVPPNFVLNQSLLVLEEQSKDFISTITNASIKAPTDLSYTVEEGGRNDWLFKIAAKMRGTNWIPEDLYFPLLNAINLERCNPPLSAKDVKTICNSVLRYEKGNGEEDAENDKVKIVLRLGNLAEAVDETLKALALADTSLYHRDGRLVRLVDNRIQDIPKAALRKLVADTVTFVKYTKDGDEVLQDPPKDIIDILFETGTFPQFKELHQFLHLPSLTPTGELITEEGYNDTLKAYIKPAVNIQLPNLGRIEAEQALNRLMAMIDQFPFETDAHKSVAVAAIMTPLLRTAIEGPTPLFLFDSNVPGTGKSKLADIGSLIASGDKAPRMVQTKEEEMEKRVTALLLSGARTCLIDNVDKPFGGASMDAVLTADKWTGRILARSEMCTLMVHCVFYLTGNNIILRGDLPRRSLRCYMDPKMERPEERENFKITDHVEYINENRAQIVSDIITIALSYQQEKKIDSTNFGSFEAWSKWIREPLIWLGMVDPVITQKELRDDSPATNWSIILEALHKIFGNSWFSVKDLYDVAFDGVRRNAESDAYNALIANIQFFMDQPSIKALPWVLKRWLNRIVNDKKITRSDKKDALKGFLYRVELCEATKQTRSEAA